MRYEDKPPGRQLRWGAWLLAGAFAASAATSAAASDDFLKLDGIQGEAVDRGPEGERDPVASARSERPFLTWHGYRTGTHHLELGLRRRAALIAK